MPLCQSCDDPPITTATWRESKRRLGKAVGRERCTVQDLPSCAGAADKDQKPYEELLCWTRPRAPP